MLKFTAYIFNRIFSNKKYILVNVYQNIDKIYKITTFSFFSKVSAEKKMMQEISNFTTFEGNVFYDQKIIDKEECSVRVQHTVLTSKIKSI